MLFSEFNKRIVKITNLSLPGQEEQLKMAPIERLKELKIQAQASDSAKRAGVMVLFYPDKNHQTHLALILRRTYKGVHSAQIGFPGGKIEPEDRNLEHTALRETEEEIGVPQSQVKVLKQLTDIFIPPSNFFVHPYLGIAKTTPQFVIQESEVEALVQVALTHFMDDSVVTSRILSTSYATQIDVPAYLLNDHVVWGATAMMLSEVRALLKSLL
jgi:8-oxo-dGTP pyrophosphatase MutT (NUDIX family)